MSDVVDAIAELRAVSTHEHLRGEEDWVERGPDVLQDLFGHYAHHDLPVAGASAGAVERLLDPGAGSIAERFEGIRTAWEASRLTGYGEAVRLLAREVYGLDELTGDGLERADARCAALRRPGERLRLLRDVALLDHVQIDDATIPVAVDPSGPDFFLHDISLWGFCKGDPDLEAVHAASGVEMRTLDDVGEALAEIFRRYAPLAIAVKSQHAYDRSLLWVERSDAEAARALEDVLAGRGLEESRAVLGDWCLARGVELATEHGLPVKLHTGYHARSGRMPIDWVRPGHLCGLLARYPDARFVLMHAAYPYGDELVAAAKHYPNAYVDLCWAWSIDPYGVADFVRRCIHAVPVSKLFAFGGDTVWPTGVLAYALQARRRLARVLDDEVAAGDLTVPDAIAVAERVLRDNQRAVFDVERVRAAQRAG